MSDKAWKRRERQVARAFGATRNPLSGGNSRHTRSDVIHPVLYIEHKHRQKQAVVGLFREVEAQAKAEGKYPVITLSEPNFSGFLVVCHIDLIDKVIEQKELLK